MANTSADALPAGDWFAELAQGQREFDAEPAKAATERAANSFPTAEPQANYELWQGHLEGGDDRAHVLHNFSSGMLLYVHPRSFGRAAALRTNQLLHRSGRRPRRVDGAAVAPGWASDPLREDEQHGDARHAAVMTTTHSERLKVTV
jgi:hypothetical protein